MQAAPETAWRDMLKRFAVPTLGRPVQRRRQNANCLSFRGREDMCQHSLVDNIYFAICSSPGFPRLLVHSALYTGVWVEMGDTAAVDGAGRSGSDPVRGKPRHLRHSARPPSIARKVQRQSSCSHLRQGARRPGARCSSAPRRGQ